MKRTIRKSGFTVVELLVALLVASIVLAGVATLANAATAAKEATDEMGREQSQIRQLTMYLTDLIQRSNGVTSYSDGEFVLWHDDNYDSAQTSEELTRVRRGADLNGLEIVGWKNYDICKNVEINYADAPDITFIMIGFTVTENGLATRYTINGKLRVKH